MSDYMFVLESHLDAAQNRVVNEMQRVATDAGMNVWLTGGAMRDTLRGARILDLDFTVERDAAKTGKSLAHAYGGKIVSEDSLKRWVELELAGGVRASVSNARSEKYSKPGARPQVTPATIHEDLMRRDFTINAMALSLNRGSRGLLIDPTNGQADLVNRELRTTNAYALFDDPSRIFRLIRFQYVLGFEISPRTQAQIENALMGNYQEAAPVSALATEIRALSESENAVAALEAYDRLGLLKLISPALTGPKLNAQGLSKFEKLAHTVLPSEAYGQSALGQPTTAGWLAFLTVLTEKMNSRDSADLLRKFQLPRKEMDGLKKLASRTKKLETALKSTRITKPSHVYDALKDAMADEVLMVLYESAHRVVQDRIRAYYQKYLPSAAEVTEEQVTATGAKPGTPKFEKAFRDMVTTHLNARPKKVLPPEPEVIPVPPPPIAARGAARK
jgi:tRNA nucleotidyltransferase (CCA-adding enzyme)